MIKWVRKYHKWLMLGVGLQFLIWAATGLYMVSLDIHYIHGESMIKTKPAAVNVKQINYDLNQLTAKYQDVTNLSVVSLNDKMVYQFKALAPETNKSQWVVVDVNTGNELPLVTEKMAMDLAKAAYQGAPKVASVKLLTDSAPAELAGRHLPVWRVEFEHIASPTFYVSQQTGQIVTKRHDFWRLFDWMWRFHIMDYDDGQNVKNSLLMIFVITGLIAAMSGAYLTYFHVIKPKLRIKQAVAK